MSYAAIATTIDCDSFSHVHTQFSPKLHFCIKSDCYHNSLSFSSSRMPVLQTGERTRCATWSRCEILKERNPDVPEKIASPDAIRGRDRGIRVEEFERTSTDVSWSTMLDSVPNKSSDFPCPIAQGCGRLSSSRPSLPPPVRRNLEETGQDRQSEKNEESITTRGLIHSDGGLIQNV